MYLSIYHCEILQLRYGKHNIFPVPKTSLYN